MNYQNSTHAKRGGKLPIYFCPFFLCEKCASVMHKKAANDKRGDLGVGEVKRHVQVRMYTVSNSY